MLLKKDIIPLSKDFPFNLYNTTEKPNKNEELIYHWHDCLEITYVKSGKGCYYVNGNAYEMNPGDIIIFNNIEPHAWVTHSPTPMVLVVLVFNLGLIWSGQIDLFDYQYLKPFLERSTTFQNRLLGYNHITKEIAELIFQINDEYNNEKTGYKLMIKARLLVIITHLMRYFQDDSKPSHLIKQKEDGLQRLEQTIKYIQDNYANALELKQAASVACMNPNYFSSFFKKTFGISFKEYLTALRIAGSVQLLKNTDKTLIEIALECGFSSMSNFYLAFNRVMGMSPTCFREKG